MNEEQLIVSAQGIPPPVPQPPVSAPPVTPPTPNAFEVISNVPTASQVPANKNVIYLVVVLGVFILALAFAFLLFPKDKKENPPYYSDLPTSVPVMRPMPTPTYQPETVQSAVTPAPQAYVPQPGRPTPVQHNGVFGVPLVSATMAYDLTFDGVITNDDVRIIAQTIDQGRYSALVDFDSNGSVDVADLGLMRSVMLEYPVVFYDLTMDQMINKDDISIVASTIDQGQYSALLDFDANGKVDVGDLAMIRGGVSEAGTIGVVNY